MGVPGSWEEYVWEDLHIVPVTAFSKGRIELLDIFVQDGRSYDVWNLASSVKPFRRRKLVRIGSVISLGDNNVEGWTDKKQELDDDLQDLEDDDGLPVNEPFLKGAEGMDRKKVVRADSKFLTELFKFANVNFDKSASIEVRISTPTYRRVMEDHLLEFVGAIGGQAQWKPNMDDIEKVQRKAMSCFGDGGIVELWIVTELKFGTINYVVTEGSSVGAGVDLQALELGAPVPVAGGVEASTSRSVTVDSDVEAGPANVNALYGFKAIRLKYNMEGNYVSRRGNMGETATHVTRAGEEHDLEVDADYKYHMQDFFVHDEDKNDDEAKNGDEATDYCVRIVTLDKVDAESV